MNHFNEKKDNKSFSFNQDTKVEIVNSSLELPIIDESNVKTSENLEGQEQLNELQIDLTRLTNQINIEENKYQQPKHKRVRTPQFELGNQNCGESRPDQQNIVITNQEEEIAHDAFDSDADSLNGHEELSLHALCIANKLVSDKHVRKFYRMLVKKVNSFGGIRRIFL